MCQLFVGADPNLWESTTRSYRLDGMVTSIRVENMFWIALENIADRDNVSVPELLHQLYHESLDEGHNLANFTSFLRVCCLRFFNLQAIGLIGEHTSDDISALSTDEILRLESEYNSRWNKKEKEAV